MIGAQPVFNLLPQLSGKGHHLTGFSFRDQSCLFVIPYVAFLAKCVQLSDKLRLRANGESQALDHAMVMRIPSGSVPARRQRDGSALQRSIVGNCQPPVVVQPANRRCFQIPICYCEQISDLLRAGPMLDQPLCLQPIA